MYSSRKSEFVMPQQFVSNYNNGCLALVPIEDLHKSSPRIFLFCSQSILSNWPAEAKEIFHGTIDHVDALQGLGTIQFLPIQNYADITWDGHVPMSQVGFGKEGRELDRDWLVNRPTGGDLAVLIVGELVSLNV
jgi:hypothetical protein